MANFYQTFKTSASVEREGVWVDVFRHDNGDIASFKVRRLSRSNMEYRKALRKATRPYSTMIEAGTIDPLTEQKLMIDAFVNNVLIDWRNIPDGFGEYMEFSKEAAVKLLNEVPDLYEMIEKESTNMANFQSEEDLQSVVKN